MTDATYIITSLIWSVYGLALGFATVTVCRLLGNMDRR